MVQSKNQTVIGIVFNTRKDQVLLVKRRDVPMWVLPGGGMDPGETLHQAVIREVFEETGISTAVARQIATYTPINRLANVTHIFECEVKEGALTTGDETCELGFFPLKQLPTPFFFVHQDWLADAEMNLPNIINKPLSQVNYFNLLKYFLREPWLVLRFAMSRFGLPINSKN